MITIPAYGEKSPNYDTKLDKKLRI